MLNHQIKKSLQHQLKGHMEFFFSIKYMIATAINVEIINGGIAALKLLPLL